MNKQIPDLDAAKQELADEYQKLEDKQKILRSKVFKSLYDSLKSVDDSHKAEFGREINKLKQEYLKKFESDQNHLAIEKRPIDLTAPFDDNIQNEDRPGLFSAVDGSLHPITQELNRISEIFSNMGFEVAESRTLDNEFNMFKALNFPDDHPAKDEYDSFVTEEGLIPPAHTSTMQHRILANSKPPIRTIVPGRVFRNEDTDATHEHTFYQVEGIYVDEGTSLADMIGTIKTFLETYFSEAIDYKTQPAYFPFVEPGLEFLIKTPASLKSNLRSEWMEIIGCGMIHPNVLKMAKIDPSKYSGFAWGFGVDRLLMLKYGIEDVRHFHSGRLKFLKEF